MGEENYYIITVKAPDNTELTIKLHQDSNIEQWEWILKTILTWITFLPEVYNSIFKEENER